VRRDVALAAALLATAQLELALTGDVPSRAATTTVAAVVTSVVALRRRAPLPAMLAACAGFTALGVAGLTIRTTAEVIAFVVLVFSVGEQLPRRQALACLAAAAVGLAAEAVGGGEFSNVAFVFLVFIVPPWLAGRALRDRTRRLRELEAVRAELEAEHARAEELAAEAERARMAREMHDVLSHSVGLITLQASAGERLAAQDPDAARETLRTIARAARAGLEEMEGVLTDTSSPQDLDTLVARVRDAGLDVELREETAREPPPAVAVAARRIVQEALTNVLKHANARRVSVLLRAGERAIDVVVVDDGSGTGSGGGTGRGLIGMRERAVAYDGTLDAGPLPDGGFAVRAQLPVQPR
jgi:signal transduction histidine kinase